MVEFMKVKLVLLLLLVSASACVPTSRVSFPRVVEKKSSYMGIGGEAIVLAEPGDGLFNTFSDDPGETFGSAIYSVGYGLTDKIELQMQLMGLFANMGVKYQLVDSLIPVTIASGLGFNAVGYGKATGLVQNITSEVSMGYKHVYFSPKLIYNFDSSFFQNKWNYGFSTGFTNGNLSEHSFWKENLLMNFEYSYFYLGDHDYYSFMVNILFPIKW